MTIKQILRRNSKPELETLLVDVLKKTKEFLYLHPNYKLSDLEYRSFQTKKQKFTKGLPLAYIVGYKYFIDYKFKVSKTVLIPRPESEWLIDKAMWYIESKQFSADPSKRKPLEILDVGTGSGILITSLELKLKRDYKNLPVLYTATDISKFALKIAAYNQKMHRGTANLIHSNLFAKIEKKFHIILANLPYVTLSDYEKLHFKLQHEPKLALTDGTNNSQLIINFLNAACKHLQSYGIILMEIDPTSKAIIQKWNKEKNIYKIKFYKDYNNLTRYAVAMPV